MRLKAILAGIITVASIFALQVFNDAWAVQKTIKVKVPGIT